MQPAHNRRIDWRLTPQKAAGTGTEDEAAGAGAGAGAPPAAAAAGTGDGAQESPDEKEAGAGGKDAPPAPPARGGGADMNGGSEVDAVMAALAEHRTAAADLLSGGGDAGSAAGSTASVSTLTPATEIRERAWSQGAAPAGAAATTEASSEFDVQKFYDRYYAAEGGGTEVA